MSHNAFHMHMLKTENGLPGAAYQEKLRAQRFLAKMVGQTMVGGIIAMFAVFALLTSASAASLKPTALLNDNVIKLGDIFDGTRNPDTVMGTAPKPGEDMVLNARSLLRLARAYGVDWSPASYADQITVRREAVIVGQDLIEDAILADLRRQGIAGKAEIAYHGAAPEILLPQGSAQSVEVASLRLLADRRNFEAVLAAPNTAQPEQTVRVTGAVHSLISVPVLRSPVTTGDMITRSNIDQIDMRAQSLPSDALINLSDLQGMVAARLIHAGQPIRAAEIELPELVDRGGEVTLVYADSKLTQPAKGKALQSGAKGDVIRVMNLASRSDLQGMVTNKGEVTIY